MSSYMQLNVFIYSLEMVQTSKSRLKPCKNKFYAFLLLYLKINYCSSIYLLKVEGRGCMISKICFNFSMTPCANHDVLLAHVLVYIYTMTFV